MVAPHLRLARAAVVLFAVAAATLFVFLATAAVVLWRRSHEPLALLGAFTLVAFGVGAWGGGPVALAAAVPAWKPVVGLLQFLGMFSLGLFFLLFPDGAVRPRWGGAVVLLGFLLHAGTVTLPTPDSPWKFQSLHPLLMIVIMLSWMGTLVLLQVYRYRRFSSPAQRSQTRWVVFGFGVALTGFLAVSAIPAVISPTFLGEGGPLRHIIINTSLNLFFVAIPVTMGMAILRHRLWEIDPIIGRTLVYLGLSALVIGLYVAVVGYLGALAGQRGNFVISLVATGLVAVLFQPVRDRLQRGVNRWLYGERDDPYAVLAGLGRRLEGAGRLRGAAARGDRRHSQGAAAPLRSRGPEAGG